MVNTVGQLNCVGLKQNCIGRAVAIDQSKDDDNVNTILRNTPKDHLKEQMSMTNAMLQCLDKNVVKDRLEEYENARMKRGEENTRMKMGGEKRGVS